MSNNYRKNKLIYFGINFLLILPLIISYFSLWGVIASVVVLALTFLALYKGNVNYPATAYLVLLTFADFLIYVGLNAEGWIKVFNINDIFVLFNVKYYTPMVIFLITGVLAIVTMFVNNSVKKVLWLNNILVFVCGFCMLSCILEMGDFSNLNNKISQLAVLAVYCLVMILHLFMKSISAMIVPSTVKMNNWFTLIIMIMLYLIANCSSRFVLFKGQTLRGFLLDAPQNILIWWKVVVVVIALIVFGLIINSSSKGISKVDACIMYATAGAVLLIRILMSFYFTYNWVLFAVYAIGVFRRLRREFRKVSVLRIKSFEIYTAVLLSALTGFMFLLRNGLVFNVLVSVIFWAVFYYLSDKERRTAKPYALYYAAVACILLESLAFILIKRLNLSYVIFVSVISLVTFLTVYLMSRYDMTNDIFVKTARIAVCVAGAVLCLLAVSKFGSSIDAKYSERMDQIEWTVQGHGKGNKAFEESVSWRDEFGAEVKSKSATGECLIVVTRDENGTKTYNTFWYPIWLRGSR